MLALLLLLAAAAVDAAHAAFLHTSFTSAVPYQYGAFGCSLATHGPVLAVGSSSDSGPNTGRAYLYLCPQPASAPDAGGCVLQAELRAPPELAGPEYNFGAAVALSATVLAVGALPASFGNGADEGAIALYSYYTSTTPWTCTLQTIVHSPASEDNFPGLKITLRGNAVIASVIDALLVLHCTTNDTAAPWACTRAFQINDTSPYEARFFALNHAFDADGRHLLVTSDEDVERAPGITDTGRIYVYECDWADADGTPSACTALATIPTAPPDASKSATSGRAAAALWPLVAVGSYVNDGNSNRDNYIVVYDCSVITNATCAYQTALKMANYYYSGMGWNPIPITILPSMPGLITLLGSNPMDRSFGVGNFSGSVHVFHCAQGKEAGEARDMWSCTRRHVLAIDRATAGSDLQTGSLGYPLAVALDAQRGDWGYLYAGAPTSRVSESAYPGAVVQFPFQMSGAAEATFPCESDAWDPATCLQCQPARFGDACVPCTVCDAHGTCIEGVDGRCVCDPGWGGHDCTVCAVGWAGPACAECAAGYYGPACTSCTQCVHGTCTDGLGGTCACSLGWAGPTCTVCAAGWTGTACDQCQAGHFGETCAPCTACANGTCTEGRDGACDCDPGYGGPFCDGEACSLTANAWRAQVYVGDGTVLAEDLLVFDAETTAFTQNLTAFPFQDCAQNWVAWTGTYARPEITALVMSFVRCTPGGVGCVACSTTRIEEATVAYSGDCASMRLTYGAGSGDVVTYFAD